MCEFEVQDGEEGGSSCKGHGMERENELGKYI